MKKRLILAVIAIVALTASTSYQVSAADAYPPFNGIKLTTTE